MKKEKWKLETRVCACGCEKEFKVLPSSKQRYFAKTHDPNLNSPGYVKMTGALSSQEKNPAFTSSEKSLT